MREPVGRAAGSQSIALDYGALNQAEFGTGSAVNTCQRTIGRSSAKFYRDRMKALQKCWDARLQNKHGNACPDPGDGEALSRIVRAEARNVARICRACGGSDNACGGGDDLTPAAIGFAAQCHDVTPPTGTSCSGAIADLTGIVTCVDCEDAFETDCVGALGASALVPYPQQCNPTPPPDFCPDPSPALPVGNIKFTATMGTADCGGLQFSTPAAPPFSGQVNDADGVKIVDLGLGCQYAGGSASISPPQRLPDGFSTYVAVTGVNGLQLTLGGSDGTGPADCSKGSGPTRHCVNSSPPQPCSSDADCPGISSANACALDANCFFGPPTPVPNPTPELSVCTMNAVVDDVCGTVDLATGAQTQIVSIRSRIFLTGLGAASPCPRCVSGTCTAGERNGLACSGGVGSAGTTVECPPASTGYLGSLGLVLKVSGGASTLVAPNGSFCPAQRSFGAFGLPEARTIIETGSGLAPGGTPGTFSTSIGAVTCIPSSGGALVDAGGDLPGPAAISTVGEIAIPLPLLQQLDDLLCTQLRMCNTLCEILPLLC